MDTARLERVLIIKPSSLGDIIHALPVASSIKSALPDARIDWVAASSYTGLLDGNPAIDRVIAFDRGMLKGPGRADRLLSFIRELRSVRYDLVIDLQGLLRSALMAYACRSRERAGFSNAREGAPFFYTVKVEVPHPDMHAVDRYLLVPEKFGVRGGDTAFRIDIRDEHDRAALKVLEERGIAAGERFIAIAASARWETKRWDAGSFVSVSNRLYMETGIKSVFVGTADEASVLDGLGEELLQKRAAAFGKTTIKSLAALFRRADAVLTNDSGPMHIAAAVGTPTLAVFGPTDPRRTGPYGDMHRVITPDVECAPCFKRSCETVRCLSGISVEDVYGELRQMLERA